MTGRELYKLYEGANREDRYRCKWEELTAMDRAMWDRLAQKAVEAIGEDYDLPGEEA